MLTLLVPLLTLLVPLIQIETRNKIYQQRRLRDPVPSTLLVKLISNNLELTTGHACLAKTPSQYWISEYPNIHYVPYALSNDPRDAAQFITCPAVEASKDIVVNVLSGALLNNKNKFSLPQVKHIFLLRIGPYSGSTFSFKLCTILTLSF